MNQFLGMSLNELEASLETPEESFDKLCSHMNTAEGIVASRSLFQETEPDPLEEDTVKLTDDELHDILTRASVYPDPIDNG